MGVEVWLNTMARDMDSAVSPSRPRRGQAHSGPGLRFGRPGCKPPRFAAILARGDRCRRTRAGRVAVCRICKPAGHPAVFAIGYMVFLTLPALGGPACRSRRAYLLVSLIRARLAGKARTAPFCVPGQGGMATICHLSAVTAPFGMKFTGVTWLPYVGIPYHLLYLIAGATG